MTHQHQHQHQHQHTHQHPHIAHQQHTQRTTHNTEHARWHRQFCLPKFAHVGLSLDPREFHQRTLWIFCIFSLRIDREQHVPDSSNHSLYVIKLFSLSNLEGSSWFDQTLPFSSSPPSSTTTTHNTQHTERQRQRHRHRHRDRDRDRLEAKRPCVNAVRKHS